MDGPRTSRLWYDVGWPLLAGLVAAAGVVAAYRTLGLLAVVAAFVLVELTVAPTVWSIVTESGGPGGPAILEVGPACALGVVVLIGLVGSWGAWALPVVALVALTSPIVHRRHEDPRISRDASDREATRRAFDDIVAHGWVSPAPEDGAEG